MNNDYHARFGMEENPFLKNSREILYESSEFKEAITRLNYLQTSRGIGLLTAGPGKGKTTAVRTWANSLNPSLYKVVYSCLSTVTVAEFYRGLAYGLGVAPCFKKVDNFRLIQDEIARLSVEKRITPVIIIDEANHVSGAILNDLKSIMNFEMDSRDRAILLLSGLPAINKTLNLAVHEPLRQRVTMNYNMEGLTKSEAKDYIFRKLRGVNCNQNIFDENALEALINAAAGIPRMRNKYADKSLVIACSKNSDRVDNDTVMKAISDCQLE